MNRRALLAAGLTAPLLSGCERGVPVVDYRTRFKVAVEIAGQEYVGASVFRTRWRDYTGVFGNMGGQFRITVWAEAAIVDLGEHGLLFALLRKPEHDFLFPAYTFPRFAVDFFNKTNEERPTALRELAALRQELYVPEEDWPIFVRFGDLNNPASVEEVTPRHIASLYGREAAITRLSMQVVDEEPARRIDGVLPWLEGMTTNLAGERRQWVEGPIAGRLIPFNFKMWNHQA